MTLCRRVLGSVQRVAALSAAVVVMGLSIGCGGAPSGPTLYPVSGVLKKAGVPLGKVQVGLVPDGRTKGLPGFGVTDANGNFTIRNASGGSGVAAGTFKVVLTEVKANSDKQAIDMSRYANGPDGRPPGPQGNKGDDLIPPDYGSAEKSPKSVTIEASSNTIQIEI
jgi:hypothetical protein